MNSAVKSALTLGSPSFPFHSTLGQAALLLSIPWDAYLAIDESLLLCNGMPPFIPPEEGKIYSLVVNETQLDQPGSYTVQLALRKVSRCLPHLRVTCMASNQSSTLYITGKKHLPGLGKSTCCARLRISSSPQNTHRAVPRGRDGQWGPCKLVDLSVWH